MSTPNLNKELARKIADEADGKYMPSNEEWVDLCVLEDAGMVELAGFVSPGRGYLANHRPGQTLA
jgi:hypothetical protein